jgi:hypothetical protein
MDKFTEMMLARTGLIAMIGKAERGPAGLEAIRKHKAAYLMAVGGAAYLVSKAIRSARVVAFEELGMEAIYEFEVDEMPVTVAVDAAGNNVHESGPRSGRNESGSCPYCRREPATLHPRFPMRPLARSFAFALLASALGLGAAPLAAQSPEHDRAYQVVVNLFDAMRTRDTAAMRAAFVPNASMQSLTAEGVKFDTMEGWLTGVGRARPGLVLDERLANPVINVDGPLAAIWVDYWFFAGERFSHCGVDSFQLVRQGDAWRIFSVVDTRRTEGCPPAPAGTNDA